MLWLGYSLRKQDEAQQEFDRKADEYFDTLK